VYGLWLTLKGKVLADSFVVRGETAAEFWVGSYFSAAALIRERLESHVIADDVVIEDCTAEWAGVTVIGEGAAQMSLTAAGSGALVFPGRRERGEHFEWMFRGAAGEPAWPATSETAWLQADDMERRRIRSRMPAVPIDIGPADLPQEAGLDAEAISFTKGCYLGQEVMARLRSMGQVRRRLVRVLGSGSPPPALPVPVFAAARQVGELRSAVTDGGEGWVGLALVSRLQVAPEAGLAWTAEGAPAMRVLDAP
jgi:folate-binding protein YgfZ